MASKKMQHRIETTLDATYRAWLAHEDATAFHPGSTKHRAAADRWFLRYRAMRDLNEMLRSGHSDTSLKLIWEALHEETQTHLSLTDYGRAVRKAFPPFKGTLLEKVEMRERGTRLRAARALQAYDLQREDRQHQQVGPVPKRSSRSDEAPRR